MIKKIIICLLAAIFVLPMAAFAEMQGADGLYVVDLYNHSTGKFAKVVQAIHNQHPKYNLDEISDLILKSYYEIKKQNSRVTLYEVADGLKSYTTDNLGIDLKDLVVAYINAQLQKR